MAIMTTATTGEAFWQATRGRREEEEERRVKQELEGLE